MAAIARTIVEVKPDQWDAITEFGRAQMDKIAAVPGIMHWGWMKTGDNEITVMAVYKDRDAATVAAPTAASLFAGMASMMANAPDRQILDGKWSTEM